MNKTKKIVFLINICHQGKPTKINYEIKKKSKKNGMNLKKLFRLHAKFLWYYFNLIPENWVGFHLKKSPVKA